LRGQWWSGLYDEHHLDAQDRSLLATTLMNGSASRSPDWPGSRVSARDRVWLSKNRRQTWSNEAIRTPSGRELAQPGPPGYPVSVARGQSDTMRRWNE